ncbi:MAG: class I SAM-dependent methyltransferase [Cyclobacteriaceae bacterium]|nr:class I SAM-dependent methyltransferase [Cyclobacteriaceae bacterium]
MKTFRRKVFNIPAWLLSKHALLKLMKSSDFEDIVEIPNTFVGRGLYDRIHAEQDPVEIREMAKLVHSIMPKVIVEIGTYKGGTLFIWTRTNPQAELIVSVDLPGGQYGGGYDSSREKLYRLFAHDRPKTHMEFIRGNSHLPETAARLKGALNGRFIDFLYIDADHTYEGVKADFQLYSPMVRKGGLIAFHDIQNMKSNHQVKNFWAEVKQQYEHREIIGPSTKTGNGVLFIK